MIAYLILGICLFAGLWMIGGWFVTADPRVLATIVRRSLVITAVTIVIVLALTRNLWPALAMLFFAAPLILRWRAMLNRVKAARGPTPGNVSSVHTDFVEVVLDHDTGHMTGTVHKGHFAGRCLEDLAMQQLVALLSECIDEDPQSVAVLTAFLDREHGPQWRDGTDFETSGEDQEDQAERSTPPGGTMSRDEAYKILGLQDGATADEIKAAHHRLMKRFHPDQGGSDYIAAKLNQAKDRLLGN